MSSDESIEHLRSIMVPVDGSHASLQAVALACEISRKNKGRVHTLHVIEVERTLPLDAELESEETAADEVLSRAEEVGQKHGSKVEGEILHAREAGPAIVDAAIEQRADLVVLGIEYEQPFGEFQIGKVGEYVLKHAPAEVWLCRHASGA